MTKKRKYKSMNLVGKANIILGIITIATGVALGTLTIIFGGYMLSARDQH
ncbi:MAG: hypothetical protein ACOCRK_03975 [bacterium]